MVPYMDSDPITERVGGGGVLTNLPAIVACC